MPYVSLSETVCRAFFRGSQSCPSVCNRSIGRLCGEEHFGGYRRHQSEYAANAYHYLPKVLRRGIIEALSRALPESNDR